MRIHQWSLNPTFYCSIKNAINWGDRKVKLVIMVSLAEEDVSDIRGVYEELYQFIGQKKWSIACYKFMIAKNY